MVQKRPCLALRNLLLAFVLIGLVLLGNCSAPSHSQEPRAAIVDQLFSILPNPGFVQKVKLELKEFGFRVDVYQGDDITVDLYRKLPSCGYKVIVFRCHSGLLGGDVAQTTWLFTNEPYSDAKYIIDQLTDRVTFARTRDNAPWNFAVSAKFFAQSAEGQFANAVVIMMGCDCLHLDDMAKAFIHKGASAYVAWNASVCLSYVDSTTPVLVEKLCSEGLTISEAVSATMKNKGPDPEYGSILGYYPRQSGDLTLKEAMRLGPYRPIVWWCTSSITRA